MPEINYLVAYRRVGVEPNHRVKPLPMANYSSAIAKAVEWLGDRYLLAKPINAAPGRSTPAVTRNASGLRQ
jgi:hypothetical protein